MSEDKQLKIGVVGGWGMASPICSRRQGIKSACLNRRRTCAHRCRGGCSRSSNCSTTIRSSCDASGRMTRLSRRCAGAHSSLKPHRKNCRSNKKSLPSSKARSRRRRFSPAIVLRFRQPKSAGISSIASVSSAPISGTRRIWCRWSKLSRTKRQAPASYAALWSCCARPAKRRSM